MEFLSADSNISLENFLSIMRFELQIVIEVIAYLKALLTSKLLQSV